MSSLADTVLIETRRRTAEYLWKDRGSPCGEPDRDWDDAPRFLAQDWVEKRLRKGFRLEDILQEDQVRKRLGRSYLSINAEVDAEGLERDLQLYSTGEKPAAVLLAVLDGSPEYGRECFRLHAANCVKPDQVLEIKDGRFFRSCKRVLTLHGGRLVQGRPARQATRASASERLYQDGCAAAYASAEDAIAAALRLREEMGAHNEDATLAWRERMHVRAAIARSWRGAIGCLLCAWRGDIVVAPESWPSCGQGKPLVQQLLLAAGVRAGPGESDPLPFSEAAWGKQSVKPAPAKTGGR
jgi:hypothetical protein